MLNCVSITVLRRLDVSLPDFKTIFYLNYHFATWILLTILFLCESCLCDWQFFIRFFQITARKVRERHTEEEKEFIKFHTDPAD